MTKPGFGVVTLVLVVLCGFGIVANGVRPLIQPGKANELANSSESFLRQGAYQPVLWHEANDDLVKLAQKEGKPILVLIGSAASQMGRQLDATIFNQRDIAAALNGSFICTRIDGLNHPDLANCFLPVTRLKSPTFQGFQCWVLSKDGDLKYGIVSPNPIQEIDSFGFLSMLEQARRVVDGRVKDVKTLDSAQLADISAILDGTPQEPHFQGFKDGLMRQFEREHGEVSDNGIHRCWAPLWAYLVAIGANSVARQGLDHLAFSAQHDWVDGGFYHFARGDKRLRVEFDKLSVENAELMMGFGLVGMTTSDTVYMDTAEHIADWLLGQMTEDDLFVSAVVGDEQRDGRSARRSFGAGRIRSQSMGLTDSDRELLSLNQEKNEMSVPFVSSRALYRSNVDKVQSLLARFRASDRPDIKRTNGRIAHVSAIVTARLFEFSRLAGSRAIRRKLLPIADRLENFRDGDDLRFKSDAPDTNNTSLTAYLGYSDAMLQRFLATGESAVLERGLRVLNRAELGFQMVPGILSMTVTGTSPFGLNAVVPEISDNTRESSCACYIRLLTAYGRILGDQAIGAEMEATARTSRRTLGQVTDFPTTKLAGFFRSALFSSDPIYAVTVGKFATSMGDALYQLVPTRLVFPAVGSVRKDLQKRPGGVYIISGSQISGPFTVNQAAKRMPLELTPSETP